MTDSSEPPVSEPVEDTAKDTAEGAAEGAGEETWWTVGPRRVHGWMFGPDSATGPIAVVLPGLGLPSYAVPTMAALATCGVPGVLLDLPGYGTAGERTGPRVIPTIESVGALAAGWVAHHARHRPVVIVGHSTGSQAALAAALRVQSQRGRAGLVLAGPTFEPSQRNPLRLLLTTPWAYRRDSPGELRVLPELLRGHVGVLSLIWSGLRDAPERRLARLRLPLTITAGEDDSYAPADWLETLASVAGRAPTAEVVVVPGSHNNLYTHPDEVAEVILQAVDGLRSREPTGDSDTPEASPASGSW